MRTWAFSRVGGRGRNRRAALTLAAVVVLTGGPVLADPPAGAKGGLEALNRGDNAEAVRLFTQALLYGSAARPDREFAYAKRAEAFLAEGRYGDAAADANRALALNPRDAEAVAVRDKARPLAAARPAGKDASDVLNAKIRARLDAVAARNRAAFQAYQAQMADYEAKKAAIAEQAKANDAAYAAALAAHQAEVDEMARKTAADMADWQRRVAACKAGDRSQCAHPPAGEREQGAPQQAPASVTP
ncbi:MAG: hypothetical protein ACR2F8_06865 [Caulobacteraceae bacterium]